MTEKEQGIVDSYRYYMMTNSGEFNGMRTTALRKLITALSAARAEPSRLTRNVIIERLEDVIDSLEKFTFSHEA